MADKITTRYALKVADPDFEKQVKQLAAEDMRTIGAEIAWLVRREYTNRLQPKDVFQTNGGIYPCSEK